MPRRALGQHFLAKGAVVSAILRYLKLEDEDRVLEIGPGSGAMSFSLAKKIERLLLVEKDPRWAESLQEHLSSENVRVIAQDFLKLDFAQVSQFLGPKFKVLSNLPYESSVAIFLKLLEEVPGGTLMVLMFQKEVGKRLMARPKTKDYGSLSVYTQIRADLTCLREVGPEAFKPPPKVESVVLRVIKREKPLLNQEKLASLEKLLALGFARRRKMLRQNLKGYFVKDSAEGIEERLQKIGASPQARAEELSVEQWMALI